jgi:hypothetical protein
MNYKKALIVVLLPMLLLIIPLLAMQFTEEVNWSGFDFVVAGALLLGTSWLCMFVFQKVKKVKHQIILCALILVMLVLLWAELAVGLFGTALAGE